MSKLSQDACLIFHNYDYLIIKKIEVLDILLKYYGRLDQDGVVNKDEYRVVGRILLFIFPI